MVGRRAKISQLQKAKRPNENWAGLRIQGKSQWANLVQKTAFGILKS